MTLPNRPVNFAVDPYAPDYPIIIMRTDILLTLWSRDRGYIADISADGRYKIDIIYDDYDRLISSGEPIKIPWVNLVTSESCKPCISFNDGRHRVRYLADRLGATQIPVMTDNEAARFLSNRGHARNATPDEEHIFTKHNANSTILMLFHWALSDVRENNLPVTEENMAASYARIYEQSPYYHTVIPISEIVSYFKPFNVMHSANLWGATSRDRSKFQRD